MAPNPRGFGGRRRDGIDPSRIRPGQYYERGFPVLSAGPTPRTPLEEWTVLDQIAVDEARSWTWGKYAGHVWVTSALQSVPSVSVAPAVSGGVWDPRRCAPVSDRPEGEHDRADHEADSTGPLHDPFVHDLISMGCPARIWLLS